MPITKRRSSTTAFNKNGRGVWVPAFAGTTADSSNPQIPVLQIRLGDQLLARPAPHRPPALDDVVAVGDAGEVGDVLVDDEHRLPASLQHRQAVPDFLADQGREAFGGFVED